MGAALKTDPPAAEQDRAKPLHRAWSTPLPRLKLLNPHRERGRRVVAELTDRTLRRRGTSDAELAEVLVCSRSLPAAWRDANEGIQLGDIIALDEVGATRDALAILDAVRNHIINRLSGSHGD